MSAEELEAIEELKSMSREELDQVPYDLVKWFCQCKGCTYGSRIRDYGISPFFYWPRKGEGWINLNFNYLLCGKHWKLVKRLEKSYEPHHIERKLFDLTKLPTEKLVILKKNVNLEKGPTDKLQ